MTTWDVIIALFYHVDEQLHDLPKHPEAHLWPSEMVTLGWGCCMPSKAWGASIMGSATL
jgi:hypothetical protein